MRLLDRLARLFTGPSPTVKAREVTTIYPLRRSDTKPYLEAVLASARGTPTKRRLMPEWAAERDVLCDEVQAALDSGDLTRAATLLRQMEAMV